MSVDSKWIFSYPRKTFLIGEYAVLHGAPAILVNTRPRFKFYVNPESEESLIPFHPDSPAAIFVEKNKDIFSNVAITIEGGNAPVSGFGFSSAEFNCVYDIFLKMRNIPDSLEKLWSIYHGLSKGSGADVISQRVKGVCLFRPQPFLADSIKWPFKDLSFVLIRLMDKFNTFEHLENLNLNAFPLLAKWSIRAEEALRHHREDIFLECLSEYSDILDHLNLVADQTYRLIHRFKKNKNILCAKGCGAMGAEIMVVFFKKSKEKEVLNFLKPFKVESDLSSIDYDA